jgi:hypothetical protein
MRVFETPIKSYYTSQGVILRPTQLQQERLPMKLLMSAAIAKIKKSYHWNLFEIWRKNLTAWLDASRTRVVMIDVGNSTAWLYERTQQKTKNHLLDREERSISFGRCCTVQIREVFDLQGNTLLTIHSLLDLI